MLHCHLDSTSGHLIVSSQHRTVALPALWLRERSEAPDQMDLNSHQRTYDPTLLPQDLSIVEAIEEVSWTGPGTPTLSVRFSDGHHFGFSHDKLAVEAGLAPDPLALPQATPWTRDTLSPPEAEWTDLDDPAMLHALLDGFFRTGFAILHGTPASEDSLTGIASRLGPIRETSWGRLFNVRTEPQATDLAYTGIGLTAHTDNPYRRSVPGIQFLHCLANQATGGESTIVDGLAIAERLRDAAPQIYDVMTTLPVSFRYLSETIDDRMDAPVLSLGPDSRLKHIRLSTRLDFPPAAAPETLALFYEGRRLLAQYAADPVHEFRTKMVPSDCLIMDNHRTLHGRTAFAADGKRFLQGCYIDHDGPECLYRRTHPSVLKASAHARRIEAA